MLLNALPTLAQPIICFTGQKIKILKGDLNGGRVAYFIGITALPRGGRIGAGSRHLITDIKVPVAALAQRDVGVVENFCIVDYRTA